MLEQTYPGDDDIVQHFNFLLPIFKDKRYLKVDGRLLFVIYNILDIPDFHHFKMLWNKLAIENGLPEFYFLSYTSKIKELEETAMKDTEGTILSLVTNIEFKQDYSKANKLKDLLRTKFSEWTGRPQLVFEYKEAMDYLLDPVCAKEEVIPVVVPNWDYTPRRGAGGLILKDAMPDLFKEHVNKAFNMVSGKRETKQLIFIKSWNEWGEGNYMEPDLTYGRGYIDALKSAISEWQK